MSGIGTTVGLNPVLVRKAMLDVIICTNPVNLTIAIEGVLRTKVSPTWLLYDAARLSTPVVNDSRVQVIRQRRWVMLVLSLIATIGGVGTIYLPHHRINRHLLALARRAQRIAYLDDGLDSHRLAPRNIVPSKLVVGAEYYTFEDFRKLPSWLDSLALRRVCSIGTIAGRRTEGLPPMDGIRHVLFESPGLNASALIQALGLSSDETTMISHPVLTKNALLPVEIATFSGGAVNSEAMLDGARSLNLYFGESLLLYYAVLRCHPSNFIYAQLSATQKNNLVGLRFEVVPGLTVDLYHVTLET